MSRPSPLVTAAWEATEAGWPVIPTHPPAVEVLPRASLLARIRGTARAPGCSCGSAACTRPAGHPIDPAWAQQDPITAGQVQRWFAGSCLPNLAVATGTAVDAWEVPTAIGAQAMRVLERMPGPWPAAARTADGRWLFFTRPYQQTAPVIEAHGTRVVHHGAGSYVPLPPSRRGHLGRDRWVWVPRWDRIPAAPQLLGALLEGAARLHAWEIPGEPAVFSGRRYPA